MKSRDHFRLLPCLLVAWAPLLGHCGGATAAATETDNSPAVVQEKMHIVLGESGVEVLGAPGAVSAEASVTVTNRSTNARAQALALADGSVRVVVSGSLQDEYEITVSNGAGEQTLRGFADANGDVIDPSKLSCEGLSQETSNGIRDARARATRDCASDSDCELVSMMTRCLADCGHNDASVASSASEEMSVAIQRLDARFCGEFVRRACEGPGPMPCGGAYIEFISRPVCLDGRCDLMSDYDLP